MPEKFYTQFPDKGPEQYREEKIAEAIDVSKEEGSAEARKLLDNDPKFQLAKQVHGIKRTLDKGVHSEMDEHGGTLIKEVLTTNLEKEHFDNLVLGVSPFNGYFNDENLSKLVNYGLNNYKDLKIFIPDKAAVYSLLARGVEQKKAEKDTRDQVRWLKNKITEAGVKNGLPVAEIKGMIVDSEYLESNQTYSALLAKLKEYFNTNPQFADVVRQASWDGFLRGKPEFKGKTIQDVPIETLNTAAQYLLAETPIFFKSKEILDTSDSLFAYHQLGDYLKKIYDGDFVNDSFDFTPSSEQGHAVFNEFKYVTKD